MIRVRTYFIFVALIIAGFSLWSGGCKRSDKAVTSSQVIEVRLARNYGLGYLPMGVLQERRLIEQNAKAAGLGDVKVTWIKLGGGGASADALLSGSVDFAALGVPPHIILWAKSRGHVKAIGALGTMAMRLNTTNPDIKSLRDFTSKDRIAVPTAKISIPAVALQMAAAQVFGEAEFARLDAQTITMKPPDALAALLSPRSEVTANFTFPPFSDRQAKDPHVHEVLNSYDVLGGPHTQAVLSCTTEYYQSNPQLCRVIADSLQQAVDFINADHAGAAAIYQKTDETSEPTADLLRLLSDPSTTYTTTPRRIETFADFMFRTKTIKTKPETWKDLFFSEAQDKPGS